jgi:phosphatidylserine/phosphatidylglycerophosphate/cardiolipin synthase-like enzyme
MGLARDLVQIEAGLRDRSDINLFGGLDALTASPECASVINRITGLDPVSAVRLCLQALRIQHAELGPQLVDAELVATLPPETPGLARPTERVVHEMLDRAKSEVILLGYEFSDVSLIAVLERAATRADVMIICDRNRGAAQRVGGAWPAGAKRPRIFQDRQRSTGAPYASMHAKCLLVDAKELLITSANFTFHGLHGNIEIGVRLAGPPAAEARKIFSHLVQNRILEELQQPGAPL